MTIHDKPRAWTLCDGSVPCDHEHMQLVHVESARSREGTCIARVSAPSGRMFTVEIVCPDSIEGRDELVARARDEIQWLLIGKGEQNPWAYAKHHCGTAANAYSRIRWQYWPGPAGGS